MTPGEHTVQQIADTFAVTRPTIYRYLGPRRAIGDKARNRLA